MQKEREIHNSVIYLLEYNLIINHQVEVNMYHAVDFESVGLTGHARRDVREQKEPFKDSHSQISIRSCD